MPLKLKSRLKCRITKVRIAVAIFLFDNESSNSPIVLLFLFEINWHSKFCQFLLQTLSAMVTFTQGITISRYITLSPRTPFRLLSTLSLPSNHKTLIDTKRSWPATSFVDCNIVPYRGIRSLGKVQGKSLDQAEIPLLTLRHIFRTCYDPGIRLGWLQISSRNG